MLKFMVDYDILTVVAKSDPLLQPGKSVDSFETAKSELLEYITLAIATIQDDLVNLPQSDYGMMGEEINAKVNFLISEKSTLTRAYDLMQDRTVQYYTVNSDYDYF